MTRADVLTKIRRIAKGFARHGHGGTADHLRQTATRLHEASTPPTFTVQASQEDITCATCDNWDWWVENFGDEAGWAHWLYCGPLGLDCGAEHDPPEG